MEDLWQTLIENIGDVDAVDPFRTGNNFLAVGFVRFFTCGPKVENSRPVGNERLWVFENMEQEMVCDVRDEIKLLL